ncbi:class E sortase [Nocardioides jiangxiensis]|uniref:Class E sortase n=1 Tax=Nocardioides jiangxiensis TaxID=3064524 RepID=A0ABT9B344_9ACTN|nr:class E sortase [Nocardioides sp. WY-20]MDO7868800.1 class E sortase [Nocardioides sp. WY-20]
MSTVVSGRRIAEPASVRRRRFRLPARKPRAPRQSRPRVPLTREQERLVLMSSVLTMVAIVCLWSLAQMLLLGRLSEDRAQGLLYPEFRHELAAQTAPTGPTTVDADGATVAVAPGEPVAVVSAPAIGLSQVVVEGTASGDLLAGPGHRRDTVLPGQEGTSLVYGRATTYGGPFGKLEDLRAGDHVYVVVGQGRLDFTVLGVRYDGDPLPPAPAAGKARLVLTTAERVRWGMSPGRAVYVDAEAPKAFPAPSGRPAAVPEPELAMQTDTGALPLLVLCLAGLVAVTIGVIAARQRWSTALVWVVATPIVIALSWGTTDVVMRLLPNLI